MSTYSPFARRSLCLLALIITGASAAQAEPTQSLAEKRLSIFKGDTKGIVLFDLDGGPRPAASAPARSGTAASGTAAASVAGGAAPLAAPGSRFLSSLPPPSGRSIQSARRLDALDQGVPLPTARAASQPQTEPATKR